MHPTIADLLADFKVRVAIVVQWGDQDAMQHVNNTVFLRWFESSRLAYFRESGLIRPSDGKGPILASITCNYRRQVTYPDTVHVAARVVRIGTSSITVEHRVVSESQQSLVADGAATLVYFDYGAGTTHPVPSALRQALAEHEGREL